MFKAIASAVATGAMMALTTGQALAVECLPKACADTGTGGTTGGSAPEIELAAGLAAVAVLGCIGLVVREKFLRDRSKS